MRTVRLKQVAEVRYGLGQPPPAADTGVPIVRATNIERGKIIPQDIIFAKLGDLPLNRAPLLKAGEILVVRSGAYTGDSALVTPAWQGAAPGYDLRVTPRSIDSRFLAYQLLSTLSMDQIALAKMRAAQPHLNAEDLGDLEVMVSSTAHERAIADYLDAETARIDEVHSRRLEMAGLLQECEEASLVGLLGDWRTVRTVSLRQMGTTLVTGPFGTQLSASEYVGDGIPVINPTHITDGRIRADPAVSVPIHVAQRLDRHRLGPGDLVLGRKGDVGRSAIVTDEEDGWICGSDSIAVRTDPSRLMGEFLALMLSTSYYRQQLEARSTGSTIANVNEASLMALRVPDISLREQRQVVASGRQIQEQRLRGVSLIERQVDLLRERRQALITAAVTGQLEIPGVAA